MIKQPSPFQLSGRVYLMIAIVIFGAANAVTRKLTDLGATQLIDGRNPISFCNVLFVGNLCALILMAFIYQHQWRMPVLRKISWRQWLILTIVAVLSAAVVPTLIFTALSLTAVNSVILVGQIDTPLVLALSVWLLGDRVNGWVIGGAVVSFIGVALTVLIQPAGSDMVSMGMGFEIGLGELLTLLAAVFKAISNLISKVSLKQIPLGIFNVYRMLVGTIFFFGATVMLYGPEHFMDVTSLFLWQWMLFYSAIIVVGGQWAWFSGLKQSTASEISLATAFNPLVGVLAAYLILRELPTTAQYIGGAVILGGIALNQIGVQRLHTALPEERPTAKEMTEKIAFKGV
ncbi:MAG: DMT family transporter [Leptolyngbya sp. SIO1D8]|nr:DMT family transporter [Leptolyngbya sp. SIO1D8]